MSRGTRLWLVCCVLAVALVGGCGRPTLPGTHFEGERPVPLAEERQQGPLPEEPIIEMGDPEAEVRIEALFPIDDAHRPLIELLRELTEQYSGKLYVRYADYRTPEGRMVRSGLKDAPVGISVLQINGKSEFQLTRAANPYKVSFLQDMGRFWAAEDLKAVVAEEVAAAYGETSGGG